MMKLAGGQSAGGNVLCCLRTRFRSEIERSGHVGSQRTRSNEMLMRRLDILKKAEK